MSSKTFQGATFAISGKPKASTQAELLEKIKKLGGDTRMDVSPSGNVTHLICSQPAYLYKTNKVQAAEIKGVFIVKEDFVEACFSAKKILPLNGDEKMYLFKNCISVKKVAQSHKNEKGKLSKTIRKKNASRKNQNTKFNATIRKKAHEVPEKPNETGKKKAKTGSVSTNKGVAHPQSSKLRKCASVYAVDSVDRHFECNNLDNCSVHNDNEGRAYSVLLVQKDPSQNMDKYYKLQLIKEQSNNARLHVFTRWGRTGTPGLTHAESFLQPSTFQAAIKTFEAKFKEKTGYDWNSHPNTFIQKPGKYCVVKTASNSFHPAPSGQVVRWQYYLENDLDGKPNGWYNYTESASTIVEECFQHSKNNDWLDVRVVQSGAFFYRVDYNTMSQTNVTHSNHTTRPIRRHFIPL